MSMLMPLLLKGLTGLNQQFLVLWVQVHSKPPWE
ncbi:unnamed protein product [Nyctereutes procyonoides]|uniref:(raccoon dog) hypothetical protein n=1 Tax=Nyctereutes procyonoides TaxID=34880 RepID=A0A811Y677_NYCPR|nr:unnamed protein product [Nyctereutes procyonoides]